MKAIAYARFSSDNQREESIDAQLRAIHEYCKREEIEIIDTYTDEARSATTDNRPGFQSMFAALPVLKPDAIIVHKLDRFSRDRYDSAYYKRIIKQAGARLISVTESSIDGSPESIILESVLEGMAEYYSKNLAREVMKGLKETAYQCKHTGGQPPLGYKVLEDKTYGIDIYEAEIVRTIFTMYASGKGYTDIINALKPYRTRRGTTFGKPSIHDILCNEKYRGVYIFNRAAAAKNGKRNNRESKSEDEIIRVPDGMPRIIDDETWEAVRQRMAGGKRNAANRAKVPYLLSGKVTCGLCGGSCVGRHMSHGYRRYECSTRVNKHTCDLPSVKKEVIEDAVITALENLFSKLDVHAAAEVLVKRMGENTEPPEVLQARAELEQTKKEIQNLVTALRIGTNPYVMEELQQLTVKAEVLEKKASYQKDAPSVEDAEDFLRGIIDIRNADDEKKKGIINRVIDRVTLYPDQSPKLTLRMPICIRMVEAVRIISYAYFDAPIYLMYS